MEGLPSRGAASLYCATFHQPRLWQISKANSESSYSRARGRVAKLTPEGQVFYEEALKTLAQAERSITTAQRAAKGEIGTLGIGFMGFTSYLFLPNLIRKYKSRHPGVAMRLVEDVPGGQDIAFDRGEIDIAFTRPLSADRRAHYDTRLLFSEPLVAALCKSRKVRAKRIRIADLAGERFIVFQRSSSPAVFDTIVSVCNDNGFSPRLQNELNNMNSVLATVEAGEGVAIIPASAATCAQTTSRSSACSLMMSVSTS